MPQVFARTRARRSLGVNDFATDKSSVNLPVQVVAVGHQQERELGRNLTAHLFREERHRMRLAAALRMPEHAQLAEIGITRKHGTDRSGASIGHRLQSSLFMRGVTFI